MNSLPEPYQPTSKFLAIGIDFGTTYSGVAWAYSRTPKDILEIGNWPSNDATCINEAQVPTQLDVHTEKWGFEITQDSNPVKWFKLLLLKEEDLEEDVRRSDQLKKARDRLESMNRSPIDVIATYLRMLWTHVYDEISRGISIENLPLRIAITVPAIWPPYAAQAMRQAADKAGIVKERFIGKTTLDLIQEPEAAGLSVLSDCKEYPDIEAGETFIVCDAGGGTVDVISYTIVSKDPFTLVECVGGKGGLFGAFQIDSEFENYVSSMKNLKRFSQLDAVEYNKFVKRDWEHGAKRAFNNEPSPEAFSFNVPPKAFSRTSRLLRGKTDISIERLTMKNFFNRSLTGIRLLVGEQKSKVTNATGKPPKKILLVGGLGSSVYIHGQLELFFGKIVLMPARPWSAVARGAVIRLLRDGISNTSGLLIEQQNAMSSMPLVSSRVSRYSYGIVVGHRLSSLSDFDPQQDISYRDMEGIERVDRVDWYLRKGESVRGKLPVTYSYVATHKDQAPNCWNISVQYSEDDLPPKRKCQTVRELCKIDCEWDKPFNQWKVVGDPAKRLRQHDGLILSMEFEGEPKWRVQVGERRKEHTCNVTYN